MTELHHAEIPVVAFGLQIRIRNTNINFGRMLFNPFCDCRNSQLNSGWLLFISNYCDAARLGLIKFASSI